MTTFPLPPGQQLVAGDKWPLVGERIDGPRPEQWALAVKGKVASPRSFSLDQLKGLPTVSRTIDLHCVTRWSKLGVTFTGILLSDLLLEVGGVEEGQYISFESNSVRGHSSSLKLSTALELETLIAWEVDGRPLPDQHGGPLRNIVPGRYFYKSVKWLNGIEILPIDRLGYWEADAGYHNLADPWQEQRYVAADINKRRAKQLMATRDFSDQELMGFEAEGMDLAGLIARGARLRNANFRGAGLRGANFEGANLSNAHFNDADLRGASFRGADVEGANFCGAQLQDCDLTDASVFGASFVREDWATLPPDQWNAADLGGTHLSATQIEALATAQIEYFQQRNRIE